MEPASTACDTTGAHEAASGCGGWFLKKPKHRKARALKLQHQRSLDDQRRSDTNNIALVDHQQHLRRLKPGRADVDADLPPASRLHQPPRANLPADLDNCLPSTPWDFSSPLTHKGDRDCHGVNWSWAGKAGASKKQHQKQSMRAAVESRRRLARGPRSGCTVSDAQGGEQPMVPSEDHRVVSTDYQIAGTQALMRVTLLAAGFVIGARGISARLIGQVTGAIVQSWTESCRPDSIPIRLFRIQGKKAVVQAAVALIEQAVAKYKDLCECKRRGEFVQREHVINGVEFYYQPPPRKAFANNGHDHSPKAEEGPRVQQNAVPVGNAVQFPPHHVWLQHLQQQQQQHHQVQAVTAAQQQKQQAHNISLLEASQVAKGESKVDCHGQDHNDIVHQPHVFFDWQPKVEMQIVGLDSPELQEDPGRECVSEIELLDHGLQQSVASLEQALQQVRLEQRLLQRNRSLNNGNNVNTNCAITKNNIIDNGSLVHHQSTSQSLINTSKTSLNESISIWTDTSCPEATRASQQPAFQLGSSLFFFGDGGLPLPNSPPDTRSGDANSNCIFLDTATPCTPFDFPHCDFLRESLPNFSCTAREMPEYSLYEGSPTMQEELPDDTVCIVCLEHPASVHLVPCGHSLFCFSCVGGLLTCPLCRQPIVALHPRGTNPITPDIVDVNPTNLNASSYDMWNWIPGASV